MKLIKLSFANPIQLLIISVVIISACVLAAIGYVLFNRLPFSPLLLTLALGFVACALLFVTIIALMNQTGAHIQHNNMQTLLAQDQIHIDRMLLTSGLTSEDILNQVQARAYIEMLLRAALANNEFFLLFQPKMSTTTGRICGAEALVRWHHPALGSFSPSEFIPIAEESGLIIPLGHWVLKTVCQKLKKWHEMGFHHLKISVNLSAHQFKEGDIVEDIAAMLWETQIPPYSLDLELTESVLMDNTEKYGLMLDVLKSMGITISIDDFGTGYSSLSYLRRFPIDALKIDKSFVSSISEHEEEDTIIRAIIAMAKGLKIKTTAEGVETKEQANYLISQEVDELQGFYISVPLTEDELTSRLYDDNAQVVAFKH